MNDWKDNYDKSVVRSIRNPGSTADIFSNSAGNNPNIVIGNKIEIRRISHKCPICDSGYMIYTGRTFMTYPPQFEHECNTCGYQESYDREYPGYVAIDVFDEE